MLSWNPISYTLLRYSFVTDEILEKCSTLFNNNYGIWSEDAPHHSNNVLKAGARVRMGVKRLRELILFNDRCFLITAEVHSSGNNQPQLIGHAFCTWANYNRLKGNAVSVLLIEVEVSLELCFPWQRIVSKTWLLPDLSLHTRMLLELFPMLAIVLISTSNSLVITQKM